MNKSIFLTRFKSLILQAIEIDANSFPRVQTVYADGTNMNPEERNMHCIGLVVTSLCGGITHNLKTPGAACTPQSVASIKASLRWALSFMQATSQLDELYGEIQSDPDYLDALYNAFMPMTLTHLVGTIASFGIETGYTDGMYCSEQISKWAYLVCTNILAFCAARDINPFD